MATLKRASDGIRKSDREQRTYRACTHCRQRKSRCIFNETPGKTPCARCYREGRDCIISAVGKQRERRTTHMRLSEDTQDVATEVAIDEGTSGFGGTQNPADALDFLARVASNAGDDSDSRPAAASGQQLNHPDHQMARFGPSPTLTEPTPMSTSPNFGASTYINYGPISDGHLSVSEAQKLLQRYRDSYHSFFPIANEQILDPKNIFSKAHEEPHLLTAILTIASKDDPEYSTIHSAVSDHMQRLVSALVYTGPAGVEAVEALLILAEWAPQPYSFMAKVGRGEEDRGAWMQVGLAVRLGYLQGLDQTSREVQKGNGNGDTKRRRLAWAACYMSDRQISVRVGKAFWSRGPSNMSSSDIHECFASREGVTENNDEAAVFQANYELTQLFSNAHDILYASRAQRDHLFDSGDYAKYLDDFRTALRQWNETWGTLSCPAHLKLSLILSYEYLRLYINAFAYQATLSRALAASSSGTGKRVSLSSPFATVAKQPDARFIYEAFDAAKVLLSTFSSFIDPVTCLRFMPLKYYLYVIYSAVFLYKAMATSVAGPDSNGSIRRMIQNTIDRLQRSSIHTDHLGNRYSRMLHLLWRKSPPSKEGGGNEPDDMPSSRQSRTPPPSIVNTTDDKPVSLSTSASSQTASGMAGVARPLPPPQGQTERSMSTVSMGGGQSSEQVLLGAFSWRDLDAVGQFAANNNNMDGMSVLSGNSGQFKVGEVEDPFVYFSAENQGGAIWLDLGLSPSDVIF